MVFRYLGFSFVVMASALFACGPSVEIEMASTSSAGNTTGGNTTGGSTTGGQSAGSCSMSLVSTFVPTVTISNDGHTVSSQNSWDSAMGNASHLGGGHYYFEVKIDASPGGVWWAQNIGITTQNNASGGSPIGAFYGKSGELFTDMSAGPGTPTQPYATGDVVGMAIDFDLGLAYFSKNGQWLNGNPGAGGGLSFSLVPGTGTYYPYFGISEGDVLTANFGDSPFAFAAPEGYAAFASNMAQDSTGKCIDEGPDGGEVKAAPVSAICSAMDLSSYMTEMPASPEMHIIGIYEPSSTGKVNVHVKRPGTMSLVLSSYSSVAWQVTTDPGVNLQYIVVNGYESATLSAPPGIKTKIVTFIDNGMYLEGFGHQWPGNSETQKLVAGAQADTGLALTSFSGCYAGESFTLEAD